MRKISNALKTRTYGILTLLELIFLYPYYPHIRCIQKQTEVESTWKKSEKTAQLARDTFEFRRVRKYFDSVKITSIECFS